MKPGPKPKGNTSKKWSPRLAYAIGLITADGYLSKDGRHLSFTSKDQSLVLLFRRCLGLKTKVSAKYSGGGHLAYHTQFGDVLFYQFLQSIGLHTAKSNTLGSLKIPEEYFIDFLRGYFDGDGSSFSYYDPVFPKSFRFYISFTSGSEKYLIWLRARIAKTLGIKGYIGHNRNHSYVQLKYSKREAVIFSKSIYAKNKTLSLSRKQTKIMRALAIIGLPTRSPRKVFLGKKKK